MATASNFHLNIARLATRPRLSHAYRHSGHTLLRPCDGLGFTWASWWSRFKREIGKVSRFRSNIARLVTRPSFLRVGRNRGHTQQSYFGKGRTTKWPVRVQAQNTLQLRLIFSSLSTLQLDIKHWPDIIPRDREPSVLQLVGRESTLAFGGATIRRETDVELRR